jgi:hypothetical protein
MVAAFLRTSKGRKWYKAEMERSGPTKTRFVNEIKALYEVVPSLRDDDRTQEIMNFFLAQIYV